MTGVYILGDRWCGPYLDTAGDLQFPKVACTGAGAAGLRGNTV